MFSRRLWTLAIYACVMSQYELHNFISSSLYFAYRDYLGVCQCIFPAIISSVHDVLPRNPRKQYIVNPQFHNPVIDGMSFSCLEHVGTSKRCPVCYFVILKILPIARCDSPLKRVVCVRKSRFRVNKTLRRPLPSH